MVGRAGWTGGLHGQHWGGGGSSPSSRWLGGGLGASALLCLPAPVHAGPGAVVPPITDTPPSLQALSGGTDALKPPAAET